MYVITILDKEILRGDGWGEEMSLLQDFHVHGLGPSCFTP